jgi:hypothetical protein
VRHSVVQCSISQHTRAPHTAGGSILWTTTKIKKDLVDGRIRFVAIQLPRRLVAQLSPDDL